MHKLCYIAILKTEMTKQWLSLTTLVIYSSFLTLQVSAVTDESDVRVLTELYKSLNAPAQLKHWKLDGGDPCEESWTGVRCSGSSVIHLILRGLGLSGNLKLNLMNLVNLKQLDLSSNNFVGLIPYGLPLNITHLNLAGNKFSKKIPKTLCTMKDLQYLNLSHNALSGSLLEAFGGLVNLREIDLSFNALSGQLPTTFRFLTKLTRLYLKSNEFLGPVTSLANLPLSDLNIEDNHFVGAIPEEFKAIRNLWIGGNNFDKGRKHSPQILSIDTSLTKQNLSRAQTSNLSLPSPKTVAGMNNKNKPHTVVIIIIMASGLMLVVAFAVIVVVFQRHRTGWKRLKATRSSDESVRPLPMNMLQGGSL